MGIFNKPPLRPGRRKDDMPEGLWTKCPDCGAMIHTLELKQNLRVCHHCGHHFLMTAHERIELLADPGRFEETEAGHGIGQSARLRRTTPRNSSTCRTRPDCPTPWSPAGSRSAATRR